MEDLGEFCENPRARTVFLHSVEYLQNVPFYYLTKPDSWSNEKVKELAY